MRSIERSVTFSTTGTVVEGREGETLMETAKRTRQHIGYFCNGRGLCKSCEVYVERGAEHLTPPTAHETNWFSKEQLEAGHRLACQAHARSSVQLTTRADELRVKVWALFSPHPIRALRELGALLSDYSRRDIAGVRRALRGRLPLPRAAGRRDTAA